METISQVPISGCWAKEGKQNEKNIPTSRTILTIWEKDFSLILLVKNTNKGELVKNTIKGNDGNRGDECRADSA
jgi:hypothetical protein